MFYRTSSPSGPLPCLSFRFITMQSRAMGIADHILPFGDLFRPEIAYWRSCIDNLRPERADFRPEKADLRPERADLRPERAGLRPEKANLRLEELI